MYRVPKSHWWTYTNRNQYTTAAAKPSRRKRKKKAPDAAKNPRAPVGRLRAYRSRTPADRKVQTRKYSATAQAIGVMSTRASTSPLKLSSVVAKPMTDGVNVVPVPVACDVNSCHQS